MLENSSLITNYLELKEFIRFHGIGESRNIEFKSGHEWEKLKYKITKALLGLSNLEYGGKVIIGIEDKNDNSDILTGMTKEQSDTYEPDRIKEFINNYADPELEIKLHKIDKNGKYFIIINVLEFSEIPTVCKKDGDSGNLQQSKIYTRPKRKPETTDNFSHSDMRELFDLAIEKRYKKQIMRHEKFSKLDKEVVTSFNEEVSDF